MQLRPGLVVLVGGLLLFPAAAAADTITLLSPTARTSEPPPLVGKRIAGATVGETRFSGRLRNVERIAVGIDRSGAPVGLVVTQRLTIFHPGDFTFLVPAPATKVDRGSRVAGRARSARPRASCGRASHPAAASWRRPSRSLRARPPSCRCGSRSSVGPTRSWCGYRTSRADASRSRPGRLAPTSSRRSSARCAEGDDDGGAVAARAAGPGHGAQGHQRHGAAARARHDRGPGPGAGWHVCRARRGPPDRADIHRSRQGVARARPACRAAPAARDTSRPARSRALAGGPPAGARQRRSLAAVPPFPRFAGPVGSSTASYVYRTVERSPLAEVAGRSSNGDDTLTIVLVGVLGAVALVGGAILWAHL